MSGEQEFEIGITDEELTRIHLEVMGNFPAKPGVILLGILLDVLPEPVRRIVIPKDKDPLTALPIFGRQLATTIVSGCGDPIYRGLEKDTIEFLGLSFAEHVERKARLELKLNNELRQNQPERTVSRPHPLEVYGQILAAVFASGNFTPSLGRHTLKSMAPRIDELVHPGRRELREAMEEVREKYEEK